MPSGTRKSPSIHRPNAIAGSGVRHPGYCIGSRSGAYRSDSLRRQWRSVHLGKEPQAAAGEAGTSRIDRIYDALARAILAQELLPGTKLSEEEIGAHFNVSRTIVRAALNRLHTEAIVEFKQNRGAFVASPSLEEARQVFEARMCIEREVIGRLVGRITDQQLDKLGKHIESERVANRERDRARSIVLSGEFHILVATMAGNQVLADFLTQLISRSSLILAQHSRHHEPECSADEHAVLVEALRSRDPQAAIAAMADHLSHVVDRANFSPAKQKPKSLGEILSHYK